ncbi:hypothetical protein [Streptomyces badius]|uniref:Uncharacterized protein n=1 Tax=Streptomyces badius TaxID=1941 RepID=A0ABQ2T6N0_STRBA|nr:hypothetical protein [Streptomyces badius]GGS54764.1 hypothetical protein GCM10010253_31430 [Streptomyces badius]
MAQDRARVPLAHRLTYAAFLTATDAEARVAWHRWRGDYPDREQALPRADAACTRTQAEFHVIDPDALAPAEEARALVECIRSMHTADDEPQGVWARCTALRTAFVDAARQCLADQL